MTLPISICLNILAERERKKALAGSKVKISGKDVVASYKILASIIIVPLSILIYTILFYFSLSHYNLVQEEDKF